MSNTNECQYCGTSYNVKQWIPTGSICTTCHKALTLTRRYKLGIPMPRITKEKHLEE